MYLIVSKYISRCKDATDQMARKGKYPPLNDTFTPNQSFSNFQDQ